MNENFREKKRIVIDDMRAAISYTPNREADLLAFMCQYIKEDARRRPVILEHLRRCMGGEPYPNPYIGQSGYTLEDVERCDALLEEYLNALPASASQAQDVLNRIERLNADCSYSLLDDWRRERLSAVVHGAADLAAAPCQEMR